MLLSFKPIYIKHMYILIIVISIYLIPININNKNFQFNTLFKKTIILIEKMHYLI